MPMSFMNYYEKTKILNIAQNATVADDADAYEVKIIVKDEMNVTNKEPLTLKIFIVKEKISVQE